MGPMAMVPGAGNRSVWGQWLGLAASCLAAVAFSAAPAAGQVRSNLQASARVLPVEFAPTPETISSWIKELGAGTGETPGMWTRAQAGDWAGRRRLQSGLATVTMAERCDAALDSRCTVVLRADFLSN